MTEQTIQEILGKYSILSIQSLNFSITDDMTEEVFETRVKEFADTQSNSNSQNSEDISPSEQFAITYKQKRQALENACDGSVERDSDGNLIKSVSYWVQDFDDTYVYVNQYAYTPDNSEEVVGRFSYTISEDGLTATLMSDFEQMIVKWLTLDESQAIDDMRNNFSTLQQEFKNYKKEYSTSNTDVNELKEFKTSILTENHKARVGEVLAEFIDLKEIDEFKTLSENAMDYENIEDLRKECYAIRGKNFQINFAKNSNTSNPRKAPLENFSLNESDDGFGGLLSNAYKNKK